MDVWMWWAVCADSPLEFMGMQIDWTRRSRIPDNGVSGMRISYAMKTYSASIPT